MATQVLVIFAIRIRHRSPFKSRSNPWLIVCSLTVVAIAAALPFPPAGAHLGFVPPPFFFLILAALLLTCLLALEGMKRWFFRRFAVE